MKKFILSALVLSIVISFAGCSTHGRIGNFPVIKDKGNASSLVLIRINSIVGMTNSYYIALDGNKIFSIRSGDYTQILVPAGKHYVAVECFGGFTPTWKKDSIMLNMIPKKKYYLKISPNLSCAKIISIKAFEANNIIKNSNFVNPNKRSNY